MSTPSTWPHVHLGLWLRALPGARTKPRLLQGHGWQFLCSSPKLGLFFHHHCPRAWPFPLEQSLSFLKGDGVQGDDQTAPPFPAATSDRVPSFLKGLQIVSSLEAQSQVPLHPTLTLGPQILGPILQSGRGFPLVLWSFPSFPDPRPPNLHFNLTLPGGLQGRAHLSQLGQKNSPLLSKGGSSHQQQGGGATMP